MTFIKRVFDNYQSAYSLTTYSFAVQFTNKLTSMLNSKRILLASFTALMAVGCSRNEQLVVSPDIASNTNTSSARTGSDVPRYDPVIDGLAKVLAQSLNNAQVRRFVKNEALKKFDGDYDILLQKVANSTVGIKTIKEVLNSTAGTSFNFDEAIRKIPLLNIAVPIGIENWKEDSFMPLVVSFPDIQDESKLDRVKAYNSSGKEVWIDAKNLPEQPIIVIGINERTQVGGDGKVVLRKDIAQVSRDASGRISTVQPQNTAKARSAAGCTYADGQYIYAKYFFSDDVGRWESRLKGLPEITMRVYAPSNSTNFSSLGEIRNVSQMEEPAIRHAERWYGPLTYAPSGTSIVAWSNSVYGKTLLFNFVEVDGGSSTVAVTIGAGFKVTIPGIGEATRNLSVTFDIANNDENIGQLAVDQCQAPPQAPHPFSEGQPYYDVNGTAFGVVLGN